ncbi:MAG TPA: AMP-dependent synthetase/ligase [Pirellulales bacterium]|nr:AMP-dependent synthetase/ligase [Pirellulales bacterium]
MFASRAKQGADEAELKSARAVSHTARGVREGESVFTLSELYTARIAASGPAIALHVPRGAEFCAVTWNELDADVRRLAHWLRDQQVGAGDRVAQIAENCYEWIVLDCAIHLLGAIHVAIHAPLSGMQIGFQIVDSGARVVVLSGAEQAAKLADPVLRWGAEVRFFSYEPCAAELNRGPVAAVPALGGIARTGSGAAAVAAQPAFAPAAGAEDLATILYSSGTTGEPKGVMLTHANLVSNATAMTAAFEVTAADLRLTFLPLSHIFARTCDLYTWLCCGSQLALAESRERIVANCARLRPTLLNGVPYFYEKVMRQFRESNEAAPRGRLNELLGGRLRACCSGGAALPLHVACWYEAQGLPLLQGYGLTESSPVISMSTPSHYRNGTVGRALAGIEIQIGADGEILTRGPHVMRGYWNRPDATADTIRAGWLHTGDLGVLSDDGYLTITGRKKEILVTAGGKNIAPVAIEALLTEEPLIAQAVVFGDGRNYLTALIVPNPDVLREQIIKQALTVRSREEALVHPAVLDLYRAAIDERLRCLSRSEQIGRFALVGKGFSIESGELTPTLKLRRAMIQANHAALIEALYAG